MGYIGNDLQVAYPNYTNIDDISGSFNGVTTSFALTVGGVAPVPAPRGSNQCMISVGGVIQRPDDTGAEGFRLSGGNIVFSSAPNTGEDFFGVILAGADYVNVGANFPSGTAAVPSITFDSDLDTGILNPAANELAFTTGGTQRLSISSAGQLSNNLGTAGAPSYTFTGDVNTGIYSPGADQVAISTGGSGRLFVDSNGRIGVGTSSPSSLLHLASNETLQIVESTGASTNTTIQLKYPSRTWSLATRGADLSGAFVVRDVTASADRLAIDSSGRVGIGTTSPGSTLDVQAATGIVKVSSTTGTNTSYFQASNTGSNFYIGKDNSTGTNFGSAYAAVLWNEGNNPLVFATNSTQRAQIDASGRLLVGTSTATNNIRVGQKIASVTTGGSDYGGLSLTTYAGTFFANRPVFDFQRSRGSTDGSLTSVAASDYLGTIAFRGSDGSAFQDSAFIDAIVEGTPAAGKIASRLVFSTTADGASSPTERMRISNAGDVGIGKTPDGAVSTLGIELSAVGNYALFSRNAATAIFVNRKTNDGNLVEFAQDGTIEGNISVSGTTVSYNGAHLSRWSQLPSGAERIDILRGTVLSNIDEMCEWGDEDNEQLNRMKVSDVEGDKNVSGVFQAWDDDDDTYTNDFYCAMTGDFIIRIGAGVTVERGDLLMSAGDGTAKPQDDDIIRSKTVAKVTSTNVTCTYDDGSYCVPCVLMAC